MKIKKLMLLALPVMALSVGIVALSTPKASEEYSTVEAADYTPSNRKLTFNNDGSVDATFSVNDNTLDTKGWLLCLFTSKPSFEPTTHKIEGSDRLHPYSTAACAHYFFASNTTKEGNISVTWASNFADQKENWTEGESEGAAGHTLADYLNESTDWYIVVGIRHKHNYGGVDGPNPGEGGGDWWENADYYVGRESNIRGDYPYGEIYIDLSEFQSWKEKDAKFGIYFFGANNKEAFSDFATAVPYDENIFIASYELDFNPTGIDCIRFNSDAETPSWGKKWNQTQDLTFHRYGVVKVKGWDENGESDALATAKISRGSEEIEVVLDNYKRNAANQSEHYNDYIDLIAGDKFVINYGSNSYYNWNTLQMFKDLKYFKVEEGETKVTVNVSGTYSFYFKATADASYEVFISKPEVAYADKWAESFLEGIKEEETSCEATKTNWDTHEDEYDSLPHSAKSFLLIVPHESNPNVKFDNYFARAIQRYDYIIYLYGTSTYNDYIGRVKAGKVTPRSTYNPIVGTFSGDNSTPIALVVIISVVSLTAVGGYIFLKRRKEN